jgi:hypothetical protein
MRAKYTVLLPVPAASAAAKENPTSSGKSPR